MSNVVEAISLLNSGEIIAYPTETFYGLGVDPGNDSAVESLLELKDRQLGAGIPLIISSKSVFERWNASDTTWQALVDDFWPGPLTLVFEANDLAKEEVSKSVFGPDASLAVRVSSCLLANELAAGIGGAITSTSANPRAKKPTLSAADVRSYFQDMFICEGDAALKDRDYNKGSDIDSRVTAELEAEQQASTIVDIRTEPFKILREGAIKKRDVLLAASRTWN